MGGLPSEQYAPESPRRLPRKDGAHAIGRAVVSHDVAGEGLRNCRFYRAVLSSVSLSLTPTSIGFWLMAAASAQVCASCMSDRLSFPLSLLRPSVGPRRRVAGTDWLLT
jgi:hypothetical protein